MSNTLGITPSPSQLLRRLAAALTTDLSDGADLLELTSTTVLRNLLRNFKQCSDTAYTLLRITIPYFILVVGVHQTIVQAAAVKSALQSVVSVVTAPITSNVVVPAHHPLNMDVLTFLSSKGLSRDARSLALYHNTKPAPPTYDEWGNPEYPDATERPSQLTYIPNFGIYRFFFKGHMMTMERRDPVDDTKDKEKAEGDKAPSPDPTEPQILTLECFPTLRGTAPIKEFLDHVKGFANPPKENSTTVYRPANEEYRQRYNYNYSWAVGVTRPVRCLESVALETRIKESLVADVEDYLTPEHQRFCANRGYPYRLGIILYGPPGTGKTSFSVALAGHLKLNVYILSLSDTEMTDKQLEGLFAVLPDKCVLLIEDIDSSGIGRELTSEQKKSIKKREKLMRNDDDNDRISPSKDMLSLSLEKPGVTLSGLLNCLDGPMSKDGRIVCMTTNAPDSLDPALIRAGRCDHRIHFGYATSEICIQLFTHLYTKRPDELVNDERSVSEQYDLPKMAQAFADGIPGNSMISPAEVQGYLMKHRRDPKAAVHGVEAFAQEIIEIKARGKNVATFANELGAHSKAADDIWAPDQR